MSVLYVINSLAYNVDESTRSQNMVASVNLLRFALAKNGATHTIYQSIHLDSSIFINESAGSSKSLKSLYVFLPSLGLRKIELLRI
jgi:hypothetical protein